MNNGEIYSSSYTELPKGRELETRELIEMNFADFSEPAQIKLVLPALFASRRDQYHLQLRLLSETRPSHDYRLMLYTAYERMSSVIWQSTDTLLYFMQNPILC